MSKLFQGVGQSRLVMTPVDGRSGWAVPRVEVPV